MLDLIRVLGTRRKTYQLTAFANGACFNDNTRNLIDVTIVLSLGTIGDVEHIDHATSGSHITVLIRTTKEPLLVFIQLLDDVTATVNAASAEYNNVSRDDLWTSAMIAPAQVVVDKKNKNQE